MSTLAEVLAAHWVERCSAITAQDARQWGRCTGCDFKSDCVPIKGVDWLQLQQAIYIAHVVDAVAAAGLAVVELPDFDSADADGCLWFTEGSDAGTVGVYPGAAHPIRWGVWEWEPHQAEAVAACWLGAAAAATEALHHG